MKFKVAMFTITFSQQSSKEVKVTLKCVRQDIGEFSRQISFVFIYYLFSVLDLIQDITLHIVVILLRLLLS